VRKRFTAENAETAEVAEKIEEFCPQITQIYADNG
jgi:hypothetical protein